MHLHQSSSLCHWCLPLTDLWIDKGTSENWGRSFNIERHSEAGNLNFNKVITPNSSTVFDLLVPIDEDGYYEFTYVYRTTNNHPLPVAFRFTKPHPIIPEKLQLVVFLTPDQKLPLRRIQSIPFDFSSGKRIKSRMSRDVWIATETVWTWRTKPLFFPCNHINW